MRDIGKNIREARLRRGLTQDDLAERLHVSRQTVSNYETGRSRPDVEMLVLAAEQLEVDVQALLYGVPEETEKRRERCFLAAEGAALLVFGAGLFRLKQWVLRFQGRYYVLGPQQLLRIAVIPLLWLLLGWTTVHACECFLGAKPLDRRWARPLRRAALGFLVLWGLLQAPEAAEAIRQIAEVRGFGANGSEGFGVPRLWRQAAFWAFYWIGVRFPAAFALCGGLLRGTRGKRDTA